MVPSMSKIASLIFFFFGVGIVCFLAPKESRKVAPHFIYVLYISLAQPPYISLLIGLHTRPDNFLNSFGTTQFLKNFQAIFFVQIIRILKGMLPGGVFAIPPRPPLLGHRPHAFGSIGFVAVESSQFMSGFGRLYCSNKLRVAQMSSLMEKTEQVS